MFLLSSKSSDIGSELCRSCQKIDERIGSISTSTGPLARLGCTTRTPTCAGPRLPLTRKLQGERPTVCSECRRRRRACRFIKSRDACATCLKAGVECSLSSLVSPPQHSHSAHEAASEEIQVMSAVSNLVKSQRSPPKAVTALNVSVLSSSLSYHLFQIFSLHNPDIAQLKLDGGAFLTIEVTKLGGKVGELSAPSEVLALCCLLQGARISGHSIIVRSRLLGTAELNAQQTASPPPGPSHAGVARQPAVHAIWSTIKSKLLALLSLEYVPIFDTPDFQTVLQLGVMTLQDQGNLSESLEVSARMMEFAEKCYIPKGGSWSKIPGIVRGHLGASAWAQKVPRLSRSASLTAFPLPTKLPPWQPLQINATQIQLLHQDMKAASRYLDLSDTIIRPYITVLSYRLSFTSDEWESWAFATNMMKQLQNSIEHVLKSFDFSELAKARTGVHNIVQRLVSVQMCAVLPCMAAVFKNSVIVRRGGRDEFCSLVGQLLEQCVIVWSLRHSFSPWEMYEFFSDGLANQIWYLRGEILDMVLCATSGIGEKIMPAMQFASAYSCLANQLYWDLHHHSLSDGDASSNSSSSSATQEQLAQDAVAAAVSDVESGNSRHVAQATVVAAVHDIES